MPGNRKQIISLLCIAVISTYLLVGSYVGLLFKSNIPAINLYGEAYIALTWPAWFKNSYVNLPVPNWVFTFKD